MDPNRTYYRFLVLVFNCLLTFGSYFCFDMPSVLQKKFTNPTGNCSNGTCCDDCLGMSQQDYNLLYAVYAWTNAVVVLFAGFFIDKVGNRVGIFIFSFLCVTGSSIFAIGSLLHGTRFLLPLMLLGRLIFGAGNGSLTIVQGRISSFWFKNKELAMAFGTTLACSRLGSVLNFFLTPTLTDKIGLQWTLWFGAALCGLGFLAAFIVSGLDVYGVKKLGLSDSLQQASRRVRVSDVRYFSINFWLVVLTIMFFYNGVFPFVADASEFIEDKYQLPPTTSSYLAGAVYDVSMVLSPFLGRVIDGIGYRAWISCGCAVLSIPVFGILAFTNIYPLVATLWFGITYSFAAATMWSSVPMVVRQSTVGTALGVTTSIQMVGIGLCNLAVGAMLGKSEKNQPKEDIVRRWKYVMIFLLANLVACVVTTLLLNFVEKRRNGVLNLSKRQLAERQLSAEPEATEHGGADEEDEDEENEEQRPLLADDPTRQVRPYDHRSIN